MEAEQRSAAMKPSKAQDEESWPTPIATWAHHARFACGCAAVLFSIGNALLLFARTPTASRPWLQSMLAAAAAYLAADLGTGMYHWAVDNYGTAQTPIFGSQIVNFQRHHQRPWALSKPHVAYNIHIPAAAVAAAAVPANLLCGDSVRLLFFAVFAGCAMFSQQFHAWAHTPRRRLPPLVAALQDAGIILSPAEHAPHHRSPFNSTYCVVGGVWNKVLDKTKFFVALEVAVAAALGHEPRSWTETPAGMVNYDEAID